MTKQSIGTRYRGSMHNKVVLVTGASSGLGAHFAKVMANAGAKVVVTARREQKLKQLVEEISVTGGEASALALDVTNTEAVEDVIKNATKLYGPIDCLVNNAGVADPKRFVNVEEADWQFVLETNLTGAWRVAKAVATHMVSSNTKGSIVNIASILGLRVGFGDSTYAISKAGVIQMTKAMCLELASKNIRVNALCPGYFETEMNTDYFNTEKGQTYLQTTTAKRLGQLDELTAPLMLLCSDEGSFINGIALPVDGGHLNTSL